MDRRQFLRHVVVLLGSVASAGVSQAVIANLDTTQRPSGSLLTAEQRQMCAILSELIIPETDTPGALKAGVPNFIEHMLTSWYTQKEQSIFLDGLTSISKFCDDTFSKKLEACTESEQVQALTVMEQLAADYEKPAQSFGLSQSTDENTPFFLKIKELTVIGYYTSEIGVTQEHLYEPMPMRYDGDAALSDSGRQRRT